MISDEAAKAALRGVLDAKLQCFELTRDGATPPAVRERLAGVQASLRAARDALMGTLARGGVVTISPGEPGLQWLQRDKEGA